MLASFLSSHPYPTANHTEFRRSWQRYPLTRRAIAGTGTFYLALLSLNVILCPRVLPMSLNFAPQFQLLPAPVPKVTTYTNGYRLLWGLRAPRTLVVCSFWIFASLRSTRSSLQGYAGHPAI